MQRLDVSIIKQAKAEKIKKLETELQESFEGLTEGMNLCPFCQYTGKYSPKGSLKVFPDGSAKCFNCHKWRRIK